MNKRINMLWIGSELSPIEQLSIVSFLQNGHEVHLYTYDEVKNIPQGTIVDDASIIVPRDKIFKHMNSYAAFADLFRWKLMSLGLGYWSDTDVICIRPFNIEDEVVLGRQSLDGAEIITPTIIKCTVKDNKLVHDMVYIAEHPLQFLKYDTFQIRSKKFRGRLKQFLGIEKNHAIGWGATAGPLGLSRYYDFHKDEIKDVRILGTETWYPISWQEWQRFIEPQGLDMRDLPEESLAVHLWNEMWSRNGVDKWKPFPKDSFVGQMMQRYGIQ